MKVPKFNLHSEVVRLILSLAAILGLFVATMLITLQTLADVDRAEVRLGHLDHAKHVGHNAANMVRKLYIHQIHTIIDWNEFHLGQYAECLEQTHNLTEELRRLDLTGENRARANRIAELALKIDEEFQMRIVPAVRAQPRGPLATLHDPIQTMVEEVIQLNELLNRDLEGESAAARAEAEAQRMYAKRMVIAFCVLAFLAAAVVAIQVVRSISGPIGRLKEAAQQVAEGDLEARITLPGKGEFAQLAASFNQMVSDLKSHQAQLIQSHRLATIGQLAAGVAHEINNPLGVILGYVKLLKRGASDRMKEDLQIIEDEASQCHMIVRDLLDLARPEPLGKDDVDLVSIANESVEHLKYADEFSAREVTLPSPSGEHIIRGDAARLRQVILNLLTNAMQSAAQARVEVGVGNEGGNVFLAVSDNGPGVAPDVRDRMMEPFFSTKSEGTGLGLAISQNIMDAHGGEIEVASSPGQGTRVTLWFPRATNSAGEHHAAP